MYQRPLELSWFSLWVATRECILQSWSPKSVVAFQRLDSSARCRSGNGAEGLIKNPSVWHKYKAKTWALDLMLRCIPYPLISPIFANTKEVLLGQDNFKCNMVSQTVTRTTEAYFSQILSFVCDKYFPVEN